jgi:polar amino acid transport system substrate-binding protein
MRLGVLVKYVTFRSPGELADVVDKDIWDIGLIGAEPQRAETIAFTPAYAEIEATAGNRYVPEKPGRCRILARLC